MQPAARAAVDPKEKEMGAIFFRGAAIGAPVMFVITLAMTSLAKIPLQGSALISLWGGLIMGPFVGSMLFMCKRVGELSE